LLAPSPTRRAGIASFVAVAVFALALVLTYAVAPAWSRSVGLDVWNYPDARDQLRAANERKAEVTADHEELCRQIDLARHVAGRLADGSLTLREAVGELEGLLAERPGFRTACEVGYAAPSFRHGVARYAINHVETLLAGDPTRRAAASARLEAEYAALTSDQ
jgi:hypothetical protein